MPAQSYLAEAWYLRGDVLWRTSDNEGAHAAYREALDWCARLAGNYPGDDSFKVDLAQVSADYGELLLRLGRDREAVDILAKHLSTLEALAKKRPGDLALRSLRATTLYRLALASSRLGQAQEAQRRLREVRDLLKDLPGNSSLAEPLAAVLARLGEHEEAARRAETIAQRAPLAAARALAQCAAATDTSEQKRNYVNQAVKCLKRLVDEGFRDVTGLKTDPDLAPLRDDRELRRLLDAIR